MRQFDKKSKKMNSVTPQQLLPIYLTHHKDKYVNVQYTVSGTSYWYFNKTMAVITTRINATLDYSLFGHLFLANTWSDCQAKYPDYF